MNDFRADAEHFINNETQFHLGILPTEQSHPKTKELSGTLATDIDAGIRMLLSVDRDVEKAVVSIFAGAEYKELISTLDETFRSGGRVCFSGCGSTGRLSILLESCWRKFWRDISEKGMASNDICKKMSNQVCSIMTGGDFALIRSVEGFEDYTSFGRHQVVEAKLGEGDMLVAISEGGETSSVIGTILEAKDKGASAFFAYNNPSSILSEHIERSRDVIERDDVTTIDLCTGPMAVAGSTRMQATTIELLVVGAALDYVLTKLLPDVLSADELAKLPVEWKTSYDPEKLFTNLLEDLSCDTAVKAMKKWIEREKNLYSQNGRITYYADEFLLDIFTDTTERAPTFMLPPFKKIDDYTSAPSWAFVKDPLRSTPETWQHILSRPPRCLEWNKSVYSKIGAPSAVCEKPPVLGCAELYKLPIGNDIDVSRYEGVESIAIAVLHDKEILRPDFQKWMDAFDKTSKSFSHKNVIVIGAAVPAELHSEQVLHIPCRIASTPLGLWPRLASKLILNTTSTATMGCCGRLVGNWMAHVDTSNKKLIDRGTRLIVELVGIDYVTACHALHQTISELKSTVAAEEEYPSPVAETIRRLTQN
jgi:N-acetylmuramic acid 6-phosphate etherase